MKLLRESANGVSRQGCECGASSAGDLHLICLLLCCDLFYESVVPWNFHLGGRLVVMGISAALLYIYILLRARGVAESSL